MSLALRLTPKGGRDAIEGWVRDSSGAIILKARVAAPPEDGKANAALVALLAKTLAVPKSAVTIIGGVKARLKRVEICGDPDVLSGRIKEIRSLP
jgi:uncharacterized protein YggU (UPF0235/DUF167 family)